MVIKPPPLRPGDSVGIVAPSWCGPARFPHRLERGQRFVGPHAFGERGYVSGTPEERAADIHQFFLDASVRAIVAAIGGDHSCHLLPLLDWDLIARHPTIFMGFSDVTVLNLAIYARTGLVTFNGPAVMTDFGEFPAPFAYTVESMQRILGRPEPAGPVLPAPAWTEEFLDWGARADLSRPRVMQASPGWTWLKAGRGAGRLVGGCLESMQHLRGTPYWPDFEGAILFFETSEVVPSPAWVDAVLQDYETKGVLAQIRGLVVGRPYRYTPEQKAALHAVLLERTRAYAFPIVADVDFGHTAPQCTLPIGCPAELDAERRRFEVLEAAVSD